MTLPTKQRQALAPGSSEGLIATRLRLNLLVFSVLTSSRDMSKTQELMDGTVCERIQSSVMPGRTCFFCGLYAEPQQLLRHIVILVNPD